MNKECSYDNIIEYAPDDNQLRHEIRGRYSLYEVYDDLYEIFNSLEEFECWTEDWEDCFKDTDWVEKTKEWFSSLENLCAFDVGCDEDYEIENDDVRKFNAGRLKGAAEELKKFLIKFYDKVPSEICAKLTLKSIEDWDGRINSLMWESCKLYVNE